MRRWTVVGADATTGKDKTIVVNAQDEQDARDQAALNNVLASDVYAFSPKQITDRKAAAISYQTAAAAAAATPRDPFEDLPGAVWRLRAADTVISMLGMIYLIVGVIVLIVAIVLMAAPQRSALTTDGGPLAALPLLLAGVGSLAGGLVLMGAGAALRMLGSIGLGVASIARSKK